MLQYLAKAFQKIRCFAWIRKNRHTVNFKFASIEKFLVPNRSELSAGFVLFFRTSKWSAQISGGRRSKRDYGRATIANNRFGRARGQSRFSLNERHCHTRSRSTWMQVYFQLSASVSRSSARRMSEITVGTAIRQRFQWCVFLFSLFRIRKY